jgi:hypothetical protein
MGKSNSRPPDQTQFERFVETARALGCDEDKERFEEQLGKIAAHKPVKDTPEPKEPKAKPKK